MIIYINISVIVAQLMQLTTVVFIILGGTTVGKHDRNTEAVHDIVLLIFVCPYVS